MSPHPRKNPLKENLAHDFRSLPDAEQLGTGTHLTGQFMVSNATRTSIIIPQFGNCHLTIHAVETLLEHHPLPPEILIVDDGSPRDQRQAIQQRFGAEVVLVPTARRRGVTAAWNLGARMASGSVLVFLNNDTRTDGPWLEQLIDPLQSARARVISPRLRPAREARPLLPESSAGCLLEGWCLAMSRETHESLGGFDEQFAMYFSDTDLQLRALKLWPERLSMMPLPITHHGHRTTRYWDGKNAAWRRDQKRFLARWRLTGED
jgi:GT2 family glycosyltransferase